MRRWAEVVILAVLGGAVACSPPGERPAESSTSTSTSVVPGVGHGSLAQCLSQHGMPAPPGPTTAAPPGVDPAAWEKAMAECSALAPGPAG